jgi:hypothetical protein
VVSEIRETRVRLGLGEAQPLPFLCEYGDLRCRELVRLRTDEYAAAQAVPSRRIVVRGAAARAGSFSTVPGM